MGLFDLFKKQSIEHLPENDQELEELYKKYCLGFTCKCNPKIEECFLSLYLIKLYDKRLYLCCFLTFFSRS